MPSRHSVDSSVRDLAVSGFGRTRFIHMLLDFLQNLQTSRHHGLYAIVESFVSNPTPLYSNESFTSLPAANPLPPLHYASAQLVTDVLSEEMEETYNEATLYWQELRRELTRAIAEKEAFIREGGVEEEDLDMSSEDEDALSDSDLFDSEDESTTARRRYISSVKNAD